MHTTKKNCATITAPCRWHFKHSWMFMFALSSWGNRLGIPSCTPRHSPRLSQKTKGKGTVLASGATSAPARCLDPPLSNWGLTIVSGLRIYRAYLPWSGTNPKRTSKWKDVKFSQRHQEAKVVADLGKFVLLAQANYRRKQKPDHSETNSHVVSIPKMMRSNPQKKSLQP